MPILIDVNCLNHVFNSKSEEHSNYKHVTDWIIKGEGIMITGGTKYYEELKKTSKYLSIIRQLKDCKKLIKLDDAKIDALQKRIEAINTSPDFDDPHLLAILLESKCRIICTKDLRSVKHLKDSKYYTKHPNSKKPKYYTSQKNKSLLCRKYIDPSYLPLLQLKKEQRERLNKTISKT